MRSRRTLIFSGLVGAAGVLIIAGAVLAIDPSPSLSAPPSAAASPEATQTPTATPTATATPAPLSTPEAPAATPTAAEKPDAQETPDAEPAPQTLKGTLRAGTDADGDAAYFIGHTRLGVGPPWFWGDRNPLAGYVGKSVTVTGHMDDGKPDSAKANAKAKVGDGPEFEVYTVNGMTVRAPGKPPWAGGPKVVGEKHPGYKGWSQGQAGKDKGAKAAPTATQKP